MYKISNKRKRLTLKEKIVLFKACEEEHLRAQKAAEQFDICKSQMTNFAYRTITRNDKYEMSYRLVL